MFVLFAIGALMGSTHGPATVSQPPPKATPPSETLTMDKYNEIQTGMSYGQVVGIVGRDGEERSRTDLAGITTVAYIWKTDQCCGNMMLMFQRDALTVKSQSSLK